MSRTARWRPHTDRLGRPKTAYSEDEARATAQRLRDDDLDNGTAFGRWPTPYPCGECGAWHVGNWSDRAFAAKAPAGATTTGEPDHRNPECVKAWPECESGGYDPRCCRFPKSCSCMSQFYGGATTTGEGE